MHVWTALTGLGWLLLLSVLLEGGGKGHKGEEVVLGGLGELEVDYDQDTLYRCMEL